jgi:hypothetical protein
LKPEWKEAHGRAIAISDSCSKSFAVYAKFLLTGFLFIRPDDQTSATFGTQEGLYISKDVTVCMRLLELAKFLQALDFQDAIVDAMMDIIVELRATNGRFGMSYDRIHGIYKVSAANSPIRRFVVDLCLHAWNGEGYTMLDFKHYGAEFLYDFIKAAAPYITSNRDAQKMPDPVDLSESCKYHIHTLHGEPCYKTQYLYLPKKTAPTAGM